MRGKFFVIGMILTALLLLSSCTSVVRYPADEVRMYTWYGEYDNGNTASLHFDGDDGFLAVKNTGFSLDIHGLCVMTDDEMILCDKDSGYHYHFGYRLYGDHLELTLNGDAISLNKL